MVSGSARLSGFLFPRPSWNCQAPLSLKHNGEWNVVFSTQQRMYRSLPKLLAHKAHQNSATRFEQWESCLCAGGWALQRPRSYNIIDIRFHVHTHNIIHVHAHSSTHSFIHSFKCVLLCSRVFVCVVVCSCVCLFVWRLYVSLFGWSSWLIHGLFVCVCVCVCVCSFVCLFVSVRVSLVYPTVCVSSLFVCLLVCFCVDLFVHVFVSWLVFVFVCLPACLSACKSVDYTCSIHLLMCAGWCHVLCAVHFS